ncbi:ABC transporter ATP-binding protein [Sneathiella sp.]|uniref:ABC transporter ATP-binding protein n=1 Tax=Sneathiella sp. TaxID=1964365 RepID=UPI003561D39B
MTELLKVEHLTTWLATREGVLNAVDDVSFSVHAGRTMALVGESGSGKSMTCLSIMGLLPENGKSGGGRVLFEGEDLLAKNEHEMQQIRGVNIGMILQDPMTALNPLFTIGNQVGEAFYRERLSRAERQTRCIEVLREVGIPAPEERLSAYPHQFSGGMRQRVAIAMNIASRPKLLIADEPTTALDVTVQLQILELLRKIQRQLGMGMILVTHDLHVVSQFCDDVAIMYAGRIVEAGPVDKVFKAPSHPYTKGLLAAVPTIDATVHRLPLVKGNPPSMLQMPDGCRFAPRCDMATDQCRAEYPAWLHFDEDRRVACWRAGEEE